MTDRGQDSLGPGEADRALAAEYALGLLSPAEERAFDARMAEDPVLRRLYADWAEDLAGMADGIAPVIPPAQVKRALMRRVFGAPKGRFGWTGWMGGALAGLALGMVALLIVLPVAPLPPDAPRASLQAEDGSLRLTVAYDTASGALILTRDAGAAAAGRALELWLIAGTAAPVSLGVLPEARAARIVLDPGLRATIPGAVLAVSDEPAGGSPTGAPTGAVLAAGPITRS